MDVMEWNFCKIVFFFFIFPGRWWFFLFFFFDFLHCISDITCAMRGKFSVFGKKRDFFFLGEFWYFGKVDSVECCWIVFAFDVNKQTKFLISWHIFYKINLYPPYNYNWNRNYRLKLPSMHIHDNPNFLPLKLIPNNQLPS